MLLQAGAALGGSDQRFAIIAFEDAKLTNDRVSIRIWSKCGLDVTDIPNPEKGRKVST